MRCRLGVIFHDKAPRQHQPVVKHLMPLGPARRPGRQTIALTARHADAEIVADKALAQGNELVGAGRDIHLHLDRQTFPGLKLDPCIHHPDRLDIGFCQRNFLHPDLPGHAAQTNNKQSQSQQSGMQAHSAH